MVYIDMPLKEITQDLARDALAGRVDQLSPSAVLALMEQGNLPDLDAAAALRDAAQNQELDPLVRAGAVRAYLHLGASDAIQVLSELLGSDAERVAAAAATALGQAGTPDNLQAIRELWERTGDEITRERASFAQTLIVHRYGLTDQDVETLEVEALDQGPLAARGRPFRGTRPGPERRRRALGAMKRDFPHLDPARQDVYEVQCDPRLMAIAVDLDVVDGNGERLASQPAMPAIIALQDPEYGEYSSAFVVLSRPAGQNRITVQINRLGGGEALYTGTGRVGGEAAMADLRTANFP
ncbi:MAG TPA: HEAT repeat domain-containing protein, partial [Propionibacteriaceae bacterium]